MGVITLDKGDIRKEAKKILNEHFNNEIDGRDLMGLAAGQQYMYHQYFGEWFPMDDFSGKDIIAAICQCIIDDEPYRIKLD